MNEGAPVVGERGWLMRAIQPYLRSEMISMILLGFASGLPLYLVYQKTSYWLRLEGIERSTIGFFYWVGLAYSFKFIWAPIVDRINVPALTRRFGHRRSWMIAAIAGTAGGLLLIALSTPSQGLLTITAGAILLAFAGATLDISIDAWRIESAPSERQANMAAAYSLGYRGALIYSGLGLVIADFANWNFSFAVMALSMLACAGLVLLIKEPARRRATSSDEAKPWLAGPVNAVAIGVGLFGVARIIRMMGGQQDFYGGLALVGVLVVVIGGFVLKATKTPTVFRVAIAALGAALVFARDLSAMVMTLDAESPFSKLPVVGATILTICLLIWVMTQGDAAAKRRDAGGGDVPKGRLHGMFATPFLQVWDRYGKTVIPIIGLVMIYRLSDFTMGVMASPLYADLGYAPAVVGGIQSGPGVISIIVGLFVGGAFANSIGILRSMIIGGLLTLLTNGFYAYFAANATGTDPGFLAVAICADNVAGGFVTTVFIAYLSSLVDTKFAATQYALFSSLYATLNKFVAGFSGVMADAFGYVNFFLVTASYAIPAMLLVVLVMTLNPPKPASES